MGGTIFSRVGVWDFDFSEASIVFNEEIGDGNMPSIVSFLNEHDIVVGDAKLLRSTVPTLAAFHVKQLLGNKSFEEVKHVWDKKKPWPFEIVDVQGKPLVGVTLPDESDSKLILDPEDILALIMKKLVHIGQSFFDDANTGLEAATAEHITSTILGCPAYYDDEQRAALKRVAQKNLLLLCLHMDRKPILPSPSPLLCLMSAPSTVISLSWKSKMT